MWYEYMMWRQIIMLHHVTQPKKTVNTAPELSRCDFFLVLYYLVSARWTLAATSFSSCLQPFSRTWHPWGLTCVVVWSCDMMEGMHDVVIDYLVTPPVTHSTRAVAMWLFSWTLFGHSELRLNYNKLQQLPANVFPNMTSLRSHLLNENVCILGDTSTNQIQIEVHPFSNIRAAQAVPIPGGDVCYLAYVCWLFSPPSVLPQLSVSQRQPAAAAACSGVLGPDIVEVHVVFVCNENVCILGYSWTKHTNSKQSSTQIHFDLFGVVCYLACQTPLWIYTNIKFIHKFDVRVYS